jgi:hypothetical protein
MEYLARFSNVYILSEKGPITFGYGYASLTSLLATLPFTVDTRAQEQQAISLEKGAMHGAMLRRLKRTYRICMR